MIVSIIGGSRRRFDGNIRARELRPIRPNVKKGEWTGALSAPRDVLPIVEDCDVENQRGMMTLTARSSSRKDVTKGTRNSSNKKAGPTQLALIGDRTITGVVTKPRLASARTVTGRSRLKSTSAARLVELEGGGGTLVIDRALDHQSPPLASQSQWPK